MMKRKPSKNSLKDWQMIFDSVTDSIMLLDLNFVIKQANRSTFSFLNKSVDEIIGKQCFKLLHGTDNPPKECPVSICKQTKKHEEAELYLSDKDIWIWITATPIFDENGKITQIVHIIRNITKHKQAARELEDMQEKYRSLVESIDDSIYLIDKQYRYLFINEKHMIRMGFSDHAYLGQEFGIFHTPDETNWLIEKADIVFNTGKSVHHEHKSKRDDRYFLFSMNPVRKADGTIYAVTIVSKDITDYKRMEEEFRTLSLIDELTGLYNRRGFFTLIEQLLKQAKRMKKGILMLYADIDNMKNINDVFGHKEGDTALIEIANILKTNYRESDIIARIGGDEFIVIPVGTIGDDIEKITERLEKRLEVYNSEIKHKYKLSLSMGIAFYDPEHPCSVEELLNQGDKQMYKHKQAKKAFN
jgi:diguanylate cyclase (GGDEF)-like protein/PAS domain S-box-containing protein